MCTPSPCDRSLPRDERRFSWVAPAHPASLHGVERTRPSLGLSFLITAPRFPHPTPAFPWGSGGWENRFYWHASLSNSRDSEVRTKPKASPTPLPQSPWSPVGWGYFRPPHGNVSHTQHIHITGGSCQNADSAYVGGAEGSLRICISNKPLGEALLWVHRPHEHQGAARTGPHAGCTHLPPDSCHRAGGVGGTGGIVGQIATFNSTDTHSPATVKLRGACPLPRTAIREADPLTPAVSRSREI